MKKKIIVILIAIILIGGVGIIYFMNHNQSQEKDIINNNEKQNEEKNNETSTNDKVAIIYFSATNTTKTVAGYIKNATNGDLFEIEPVEKYTSSDLNYGNNDSRANKEQNDSSARPEIANKIDVSSYDTIYLGYPIWWGDVPKIILTFLDTHDLSGKTVIPFCTSGSSSISSSVNTLKNYNNNVNWLEGKRFTTSSESEIKEWVKTHNN